MRPVHSEADIPALSSSTLQDEAESSEGSWKKLEEVIGKLKEYCPSVAEIIQEKCQNTHTRYASRCNLNDRADFFYLLKKDKIFSSY